MSLAEIKAELKTMNRAERMTLVEYLEILNRLDDPNVREEVNAAMQRMDAGRRVTEEEVLAADRRLHAEAPPGPDETELKASLLAAVRKPTRAYRKGEFVELAQRVVAEERGA